MNNDLTYKGFVCINGQEHRLVVKDDKLFRTLPLISQSQNFDSVNDFTAQICGVKFYDGTEQVSLEYVLENHFEDIVISINTNGTIQIESSESIFEIIKVDYDNMKKMWEFVDDYYASEEGKILFEIYSEKNVWEKNK